MTAHKPFHEIFPPQRTTLPKWAHVASTFRPTEAITPRKIAARMREQGASAAEIAAIGKFPPGTTP